MKKLSFLLAVFFILTINCFAQSYPNFTGVWELNISKSQIDDDLVKFDEQLFVKNIGQSLRAKYSRKNEFAPNTELNQRLSSINNIHTYLIDRGMVEMKTSGGDGIVRQTHEASSQKKAVKLKWTKTSYKSEGEFTIKTEELWTLSDDGQILTIKRNVDEFGSKKSSTLVYEKVIFSTLKHEAERISEALVEDLTMRRPQIKN